LAALTLWWVAGYDVSPGIMLALTGAGLSHLLAMAVITSAYPTRNRLWIIISTPLAATLALVAALTAAVCRRLVWGGRVYRVGRQGIVTGIEQ
jgi:hypothetical protein